MRGTRSNERDVFIGARLPAALRESLARSARSHERTLSGELRHLIREHVGSRCRSASSERDDLRYGCANVIVMPDRSGGIPRFHGWRTGRIGQRYVTEPMRLVDRLGYCDG